MRGLGGKIVGAARIINTNFVKKVYHPITTNEERPSAISQIFFVFSAGEKRAPKFKKIY